MLTGYLNSEARKKRHAARADAKVAKYQRRLAKYASSADASTEPATIDQTQTTERADETQNTFTRFAAKLRRKQIEQDQDQSSSPDVSLTPSQQLRLDLTGQIDTEYKPEPYQQVMLCSKLPTTIGQV